MQDLFDAVREACSADVWSRGVELVRADAVSGETAGNEEIVFRVATRGGMVSPSVTLYLSDDEWECSCAGRDDPCDHVAAAVIALRQARKAGRELPAAGRSAGRIRYCFRGAPGGKLDFEREIVTDKGTHLLTTTLDAIASGRVEGPGFSATPADVEVELALGARRRGFIPREAMPRLLDALSACTDVRLDGEPVRTSSERVGLIGVLEDEPGGFRLRVDRDPSITRDFAEGVVLCTDTLHAVGESGLTGREIADLPDGRFYPNDRAAELVSEVLPSLQRRIHVDVRTTRLPRPGRAEPARIELRVERDGDALSILPLLVYGDPPRARVDAGELVHLKGELPQRDRASESRATTLLRRELGLAPGHRVNLEGEDALEMAERLMTWRGALVGDAHHSFARALPVEPRWEIDDDRFDLHFESPANAGSGGRPAGRASAEAVLRAWRDDASHVSLLGGGLAALPAEWLRENGARVAALLAAREAEGRVPAHALPELARLCDDLDEPRPAAFSRLAPLLDGFDGIPHAPLPEDLRAELRPYQQTGIDWLCFLRDAGLGALLADDMGLGKTLQALCALRGRVLVVCPTSVIHNWADEAARFRPGLRVDVYHGPRRRLDSGADLTLTSYALLRLDVDTLAAVDWDAVVLDEAQAIKNPESQVAQAALSLRARWRVALTGTPVENRLDELWSQLHFLNRGLLGGRSAFREDTARPIAEGDPGAAERLRARIRPFLLRRLKRDVAPELPPRTDVVLHCVLADEERRVYDAIHAATRDDVVRSVAAGGSVLAALEALLRLRQAACHSGLVPGQSAESSSKVDLLVGRLEEAVAEGHKALVFSQWTQLLDRIEPQLDRREIPFTRLDGSTRDRAGVVGGFQAEDGPPVMLVSLKAGGVGLNLTAADHIFLLDPWWNPAVEDQAADRAHRIGQVRPVCVHRLVAEDTVEERILALQERKRELADVAMGEADQASALSRRELLDLLA